MRTVHDPDLINELKLKEEDIKQPISYIDSINVDSYSAEMHCICIRFIREATTKKSKECDKVFTRDEYSVKEEKDVSNKNDGYYYTAKEAVIIKEKSTTKTIDHIFVVYEKNTYVGYISTYSIIKKLFTLTCFLTSKVVPKVFSTKATFNDFDAELRCKVAEYRSRTTSVPIDVIVTNNIANNSDVITVNHILPNKLIITKKS